MCSSTHPSSMPPAGWGDPRGAAMEGGKGWPLGQSLPLRLPFPHLTSQPRAGLCDATNGLICPCPQLSCCHSGGWGESPRGGLATLCLLLPVLQSPICPPACLPPGREGPTGGGEPGLLGAGPWGGSPGQSIQEGHPSGAKQPLWPEARCPR